MNTRETEFAVEAILFAAGDAVPLKKLAEVIGEDEQILENIIKKMMDDDNFSRRGTHIIKLEDQYQMCTRSDYYEYVARLAEPGKPPSLSNAALEVLAVIAYRQPVTKSAVEGIRGVNSDYIFNRLLERNLIEELGRLDAPGRPLLFGTTQEFLRAFGISSISQLPDFDEISEQETEIV